MKKLLFIFSLFISLASFAQTKSATATLTATGTDPDGTVVSYAWAQVSGPACTIVSNTVAKTDVSFNAAGTYVFQCTVTDNSGATANAQATVIVTAANVPPTVVINPSTITVQLK